MNTFLAVSATLLSVAALADAYKWVDKDGTIHYSDHPPQDAQSETLEIESTDVSNRPGGNERQERILKQIGGETESSTEDKRVEFTVEDTRNDVRFVREQRCLEARKEFEVLQEQMPVYRDEEGHLRAHWRGDTYRGQREYVEDAMRPAEVERAVREIVRNCEHPDDVVEQNLVRTQWVGSEYCAAARSELEALEKPSARTDKQSLERKRKTVEKLCNQQ